MPQPQVPPLEIKVIFRSDGTVTVDPHEAVINRQDPSRPSTVDWVFADRPAGVGVKIMWQLRGCFNSVEETEDLAAIRGRENTGVGGTYQYAVVVHDPETGQILRGIDPKLVNDPPP